MKHLLAKYGGDKEGIYLPMPPLSGCIIVRLFIHLPLLLDAHLIQATYSIRPGLFKPPCRLENEYQIAQFLSKQSSLSSLEGFEGILAPLELLDVIDHCIVVYPKLNLPLSDHLRVTYLVKQFNPLC